ncbi:hypothetical protein TW86_19950 [Halomonas sp. S2151]|nr:hypothetical protein TW86_19950 [Halomonas sp. S2151]
MIQVWQQLDETLHLLRQTVNLHYTARYLSVIILITIKSFRPHLPDFLILWLRFCFTQNTI